MPEVRWTPLAANDLEAISEFVSRDSPYYANILVLDVMAGIERLADFPHLGRLVPEVSDPQIRELLLGNYRIIYRYRLQIVEVLTIYHSARLLDPSTLK